MQTSEPVTKAKPQKRGSLLESPQDFDDAVQPFQIALTDWMGDLSEAVAELEDKQAGRFSDSRQDKIDELQERLTALEEIDAALGAL